MKSNNPDRGLLLICLLMTVIIAIGAGLIISADSTNPIETLMFFVRDGVTSALDKGDSGEEVPDGTMPEESFIVPDIPLPPDTTDEAVTTPETTLAPDTEEITAVTTASPDHETTKRPEETTQKPETTKKPDTTKTPETSKPVETTKHVTTDPPMSNEEYFSDTLFLGDSRTVGFHLYAKIPGATYFARTSMNVYNVFDNKVSETSDTSSYTLSELLSQKKFSRIYILLGINEIGYSYSSVVSNYSKVIGYIQQYQPEAKIIIQSNMHVTKKKSDANPNTFSNTRIDELNRRLSELADNKEIYYLGFEDIFDDATGAMSSEYSGDGVHLYGKCYKLWRDWILENGKIY